MGILIALAILVLIILSFIFSGSEVAYFSLKPRELEESRPDKLKNRILRLLKDQDYLLSFILVATGSGGSPMIE